MFLAPLAKVAGFTYGGQVLTAKTRQVGSRHQSNEGGSDGALDQSFQAGTPGATAWRQPFGDPPGQGRRNAVGFG
jgi:hypothetical protein